MYQKRKNKISVKQIASFLNANYTGKDFKITAIGSLNNIRNNSVLFYTDLVNVKFQIKDNITYDLKKLEKFHDILLITTNEFGKKINVPVILSKNPRLDFQRVAMEFFADDEFKPGIHDTAVVEENVMIGKNVFVGANCYIGKNVKIGNNTMVLPNTCIFGKSLLTKLNVPTKQLSPILQPSEITEFGASQHPFPICARPQTTEPAVI